VWEVTYPTFCFIQHAANRCKKQVSYLPHTLVLGSPREPVSNYQLEPSFNRYTITISFLLLNHSVAFVADKRDSIVFRTEVKNNNYINLQSSLEYHNFLHNLFKCFTDMATQNLVLQQTFACEQRHTDILTFHTGSKSNIITQLLYQLEKHNAIKWYVATHVRFTKINQNNDDVFATPIFHGKTRILLKSSNVHEQFTDSLEKILESFEGFSENGSGWVLDGVEKIQLCVVKYNPLHVTQHTPKGSAYIKTPANLTNSTCGIINIKNANNKCFLYCILEHLFPDITKHRRVNYYTQHESKINTDEISYPVTIKDIDIFESKNPNLGINVFTHTENRLKALRLTPHVQREVINLLFLTEGDNSHYCLIKNSSKLLKTYTAHTPTPETLQHPSLSIINISSGDNRSFVYSILAKLRPDPTKNYRMSYFTQFKNVLKLTGIEFPVKNKHIDIFEVFNCNISIDVYTYEKEKVTPFRLSKHRDREH